MQFTDQTGYSIILDNLPKRIVSLVPSQTELLYTLGLQNEVVGITKFCIHPSSWKQEKTCIGGTKKFRMDTIDELKPDLIIGNKEENYQEGIETLRQKYPVWTSDIANLDEAIDMINQVGTITGKSEKAKTLTQSILSEFEQLKGSHSSKSVLYLIWKNPYMAAGKQTFIDHMISAAGWTNVVSDTRYPEINTLEIQQLNPDLIFLSSEPYPFKEKHINELQEQLPASKVLLVDGELFSWYGSRLLKTGQYLNGLREMTDQL
ncbi:helical backbone metal receptor [Limibacter armeniacum]|uniref:ABC transporter substrate-binding protein n=1 Tax=Limibacter armeniacum TaxID=466084 RepID=UPI002FE6AB31